jgi:hypothetical protein
LPRACSDSRARNRANLAAAYAQPLKGRTQVRLLGRIDNLFGAVRYESGFRTPGRYATAGVGVTF